MKKLLFLLLLPALLHAQTATTGTPYPSEYATLWLRGAQAFVIDNSIPTLLSGQPSGVTALAAGMHHHLLLDNTGRPWVWGDNQDGNFGDGTTGGHLDAPKLIATDGNGGSLAGCKLIAVGCSNAGYYSVIVKSDGSAWYTGNLFGSPVTKFTQLSLPAGTVVTKLSAGPILAILDTKGNVYTAGSAGDYWAPQELAQGNTLNASAPGKISLPAPATDIAVGGFSQAPMAYALLQTGQLAAWGYRPEFYGMAGKDPQVNPIIVAIPGLPTSDPIREVHCNTMTTAIITKSGRLFLWGDNAMGNIGSGIEIDYANSPKPYAWDWGVGDLMQTSAVEPAPGLRFAHIWGSANCCFTWFAQDTAGSYYSWGRNKGHVLGNGVEEADTFMGGLGGEYPNSWDIPFITRIDPFALTGLTLVTSRRCVTDPGASSCAGYGQAAGAPPVLTVGATASGQNVVLNASAIGAPILYYAWTQISGPNTAVLTLPSAASPAASGLIAGIYVFQVTVTDQNWRQATAKVSVTIGAPPPPPTDRPPVANIAPIAPLTLPADTILLDASASVDSDGIIIGYAWSQMSGPAAVIQGQGAKVTAYATAAGSYVFKVVVTDNNGATSSAQASITVNPAPPCPICPACPPPMVCPVCPPVPAPRTVTGITLNLNGQNVIIPMSFVKTITFSDGTTQ